MNWNPPTPQPSDGPPRTTLPAFAGPHAVIVSADDFAAGVGGFQVYRTGAAFTLAVRTTKPDTELHFGGPPMPETEPCHLSVEYPDGIRVTGDRLANGQSGLRLTSGGGGGSSAGIDGGSWDLHWWLWPLPEAGPLRFELTCPTLAVSGVAELDSASITSLAGQAYSLTTGD